MKALKGRNWELYLYWRRHPVGATSNFNFKTYDLSSIPLKFVIYKNQTTPRFMSAIVTNQWNRPFE